MDYPKKLNFKVDKIFGSQDVAITLYSGLTTFVGTNGSGKTQTLKALRNYLKNTIGVDKVRYLTSNRIGTMEQYRSKTDRFTYSADDFNVGDQKQKSVRHQIETANGDFFTMDERKDIYIKVAERLSVLFDRQIFLRWDAGNLKVYFEKSENPDEYPVTSEASGLVNIVAILAALFDESIEVLLIDELEVSLHPQLQSYLLREIKTVSAKYNKTIIISTHSAEMVECSNSKDLCNFVFFNGENLPLQISPKIPELNNQKLKEFLFRIGLIYKEAFFAKKILLIEGSSDMILCNYLSNRFNLNLDVAGSQIIPVEGKGQFPVIAKLFRMIGKEVCILTDLDGFTDDNTVIDLFSNLPEAIELANYQGLGKLQELIRSIKSTLNELIDSNKTAMECVYKEHPYWKNRDPDSDEKQVIRRSIVAMLFAKSDDTISTWPSSAEWKSIKTRLCTLFNILERLGCFILQRGAIESYYSHAANKTFDGKPSAAALEASLLEEDDIETVETQYADVIRALKFAALDKIVDESYALKKELLSELALVIGVLNEQTTESSLISVIKQAKGNSKSLFTYHILHEPSRIGVEVILQSAIIDVKGFPFKIFKGDNVNQVVEQTIKS